MFSTQHRNNYIIKNLLGYPFENKIRSSIFYTLKTTLSFKIFYGLIFAYSKIDRSFYIRIVLHHNTFGCAISLMSSIPTWLVSSIQIKESGSDNILMCPSLDKRRIFFICYHDDCLIGNQCIHMVYVYKFTLVNQGKTHSAYIIKISRRLHISWKKMLNHHATHHISIQSRSFLIIFLYTHRRLNKIKNIS